MIQTASAWKQLKHCTFEDRFTIGDGPVVWRLALATATENLTHLGQVYVTDGVVSRWVPWGTRMELV